MAALLPCVELEPAGPARSTILWLHGLGADAHDFEPIVPYLGLPAELGVRFVFPHAPRIPVSVNGGMVMPAWYDLAGDDLARLRHDEPGVLRSAAHVTALLEREARRGVPAGRLVLAGFSQGGAIAQHVALRHPEPLAGLVVLSSYLVRGASLEEEAHPANAGLPVFQAHGTHDPVVPYAAGEAARERLLELGHPLEWHTYPIGHEVSGEEIADLGAWLARRLSP